MKGLPESIDSLEIPQGTPLENAWKIGRNALATVASLNSEEPSRLPRESNSIKISATESLSLAIFSDSTVNAVAFRSNGNSWVGVYYGLLMALVQLVVDIWADPRFAPWIGEVSADQASSNKLNHSPLGLDFLYQKIVLGDHGSSELERTVRNTPLVERQVATLSAVRREAMRLSMSYAFQFIWFHEIGHVVMGHVDYRNRAHGINEFMEVMGSPDCMPSALSQVFEYEADSFAHRLVIGNPLEHIELKTQAGDKNMTIESSLGLTLWDASVLSVLGCIFATMIFHASRHLTQTQGHGGSHPPPWFRTLNTLAIAGDSWSKFGNKEALEKQVTDMMSSLSQLNPIYLEWIDTASSNEWEAHRKEYYTSFAENVDWVNTNAYPIIYEPRQRLQMGIQIG